MIGGFFITLSPPGSMYAPKEVPLGCEAINLDVNGDGMWIDRLIEERIYRSAGSRPVVMLNGARQTGKS